MTGMLMDWRQMAGKPTAGASLADTWQTLNSVWSGGMQVGTEDSETAQWDGQIDPRRGWIIALCWLAACGAEYVPFLRFRLPSNPLVVSSTYTHSYADQG